MHKISTKQELNTELSKNAEVLALFYSSWCPYCIRFVPVFDKKVSDVKVNAVIHVLLEDDDNPLWDDYNIPAVPTVIYFKNSKVCNRLDGRLGLGLNAAQLDKWLETLKQT